ncbi:MAG: MBL fold metallo-hydrolase [Cohaesibacteraceae bacterium]|nr:MBL fold metallo-hydrolase [Cohaesibacteraceae bacterium]
MPDCKTPLSRRGFVTSSASLTGGALLTTLLPQTGFAAAPKADKQTPGIYRLKVGDIEITALLDGHMGLHSAVINGYDQERAQSAFDKNFRKNPFPDGTMPIPVNGYIINTGDRLIVVDAGTADHFGPDLGHLKSNMELAGYRAQDVDIVYITHLHADHIGGLIDKEGKAVFPNAELITHETDWNFWHDDGILSQVPEPVKKFFHIARSSVMPYANNKTLIGDGFDIAPGITSMALPGHTPGHSGLAIQSGNQEVLIWGDIIHATALQFANPEWTLVFDIDGDMARNTRMKILDRVASDRTPVLGMHLDFPGAGHVERDGEAFRYHASSWQYLL